MSVEVNAGGLVLMSSGAALISSGSGGTAPGVTGVIADGNSVTIAYDGTHGFGSNGPGSNATIILFDDCSTYSPGNVGSRIPNNVVIGSYDGSQSPGGVIATGGRGSSGLCMLSTTITQSDRTTQGGGKINRVQFNGNYAEVYVFRAVQLVQQPTASASWWKTIWVFYNPNPGPNDMVLGTFSQGQVNIHYDAASTSADWQVPTFALTGGSQTVDAPSTNWNIWESYYCENPTGGNNDTAQFRSTCHNVNTDSGVISRPISTGGSPRYYQAATIPGWNGDINDSRIQGNMQTNLQDIYIAVAASGPGGGALARVMIGNASTLSSCTDLAISTPTAWSNTSITCTIRRGGFNPISGGSLYLYVVDANGSIVLYNGNQGRLIS